MDIIEKTPAIEAGEVTEEDSLILRFAKPYVFEGRDYTELNLSALEDATGADISAVGKILSKSGFVTPMPEMTMDFSLHMAGRITHLPIEFFSNMPAREAIKLKNIVTGFLYGGGGDN